MMTALLIVTAALLQPPDAVAALTVNVPERVHTYLARCEAVREAQVRTLEQEIDKLAARFDRAQGDESEATQRQLAEARERLEQLQQEPAPLVPIPLPTKREEVGCLPAASYADPSREHAVDVLEVVDGDDVIVRAWYAVPAGDGATASAPNANATTATENGATKSDAERTFVDLWIRGVDTTGMRAGSPATLEQVFWVSGDQPFDTDCGKRILPKLEPLDVERFRSRRSD